MSNLKDIESIMEKLNGLIVDPMPLKETKKGNIVIKTDEGNISFYLSKKVMDSSPETFETFVKDCENKIRTDPRYDEIKNKLINVYGFNKCAYYGKIDTSKVELQMHHGPVFTLFDLTAIITDHLLHEYGMVCTMDVVDEVLSAHEENLVQLVMVTVTAHEMVHDGDVFIHWHQCTGGDVLSFLRKYKYGVRQECINTFDDYLEQCRNNDATDNDMLKAVKKRVNKYIDKNKSL